MEELDATLSADEFAQWLAFDAIEPIGGPRGDLQAGIVASTIANVNRARGSKAFSPFDFMPLRERDDVGAVRRAVAAKARAFFDNYSSRWRAKHGGA